MKKHLEAANDPVFDIDGSGAEDVPDSAAWLGTGRLIETGETDPLAAALTVIEDGDLALEATLAAVQAVARECGDIRLETFATRALDILDGRG